MAQTHLSEEELEFIANAAMAFDGMIAEEAVDLAYIAEIARFLITIYAKSTKLSEQEKNALRLAYKVLR
ncbi:MAG: hypothetical protein ACO2ZM_05830 [Francisellaceae bacterium]